MDLVQAYVDRTGDVQTAAILGSYVCPARFRDPRVELWVESYRDLLDRWKLFHFRCQFDIERGQMLQHLVRTGSVQPTEWVERQLFIRCNYCSKILSPKQGSDPSTALGNTERVRVGLENAVSVDKLLHHYLLDESLSSLRQNPSALRGLFDGHRCFK